MRKKPANYKKTMWAVAVNGRFCLDNLTDTRNDARLNAAYIWLYDKIKASVHRVKVTIESL